MLVRLALLGPRAALLAPRAALGLVGSAHRRALVNAFSATVALAGQVADRRRLAPAEADDSPGALSRIDREECLALLATRTVGRLAYVARADVPDVVPVNYALHDGAVLIRSGVGPKLQAAERRAVVVLEVDAVDEQAHTGWSVVLQGRARRLSASERDALPAGALPTAWANGPRTAVVRIDPTRVDGRRLT